MTTRLDGPAVVLDAVDAARLATALRDAIRLGWLSRGLHPPQALVEFSDQVHHLARQVRVSPQVTRPGELDPANMRPAPSVSTPEQMTVDQAAATMGVTPQHVRRLARRGDLYGSQAAGRGAWVLDAASVAAWTAGRPTYGREAAA